MRIISGVINTRFTHRTKGGVFRECKSWPSFAASLLLWGDRLCCGGSLQDDIGGTCRGSRRSSRPDSDTTRDADRKPAQTLAFSGIKPGDKVADYVADSGYFTRLFASVVGSKGHVYAVEPTAFFKYQSFPKAVAELQGYAVAHPNVTVTTAAALEGLKFPRSSTCSGFPKIITTCTTSSWARSTPPRLTRPSTVR
jgi:hypothetical protein